MLFGNGILHVFISSLQSSSISINGDLTLEKNRWTSISEKTYENFDVTIFPEYTPLNIVSFMVCAHYLSEIFLGVAVGYVT